MSKWNGHVLYAQREKNSKSKQAEDGLSPFLFAYRHYNVLTITKKMQCYFRGVIHQLNYKR